MEGKLKKIGNEYKLYAQDDSCIATSWHSPYQRLSKKNCQAIVNGYDLDELAENNYPTFNLPLTDTTAINTLKQDSFKEGFQKALEILGDKKFSEEDVTFMFQLGFNLDNPISRNEYDAHIQSLQQTEWDVEVVIECGEVKQCECSSNENCLNPQPKLDEDGCLMLKRI